MKWIEINPAIKEKLANDIKDDNVRNFILEVLKIEQDHEGRVGKRKKYESALAKYARTGE